MKLSICYVKPRGRWLVYHKSMLYVGPHIPASVTQQIQATLQLRSTYNLGNYLGVPLITNREYTTTF